MTTSLDAEDRNWVAVQLGGDPESVTVSGLRDGGAPWLVSCRQPGGATRRAVLRIVDPDAPDPQREPLGMRIASAAGIPVPEVIAERPQPDGLLLIEHLPGSSHQPQLPDRARLHAIGAVAARIFAVATDGWDLPHVDHPIPSIDFDALRAEAEPDPLTAAARRRIDGVAPGDPIGFTHGDLWSGNVLWWGAEIVGVLDWDGAGRAAAGVDLGSLRCDAAMCYGGDAPDQVLAGWEAAAGRPADSIAYWDVVAALCTPPDIAWFAPAISGMTGRADLTAEIIRQRRDAFLADALDRLG